MQEDFAYHLLREATPLVPSNIINFGRALETYLVGVDFEWPYYLEKPWKWAKEYAAWQDAGRPSDESVEWPAFCEAMDVIVNDS